MAILCSSLHCLSAFCPSAPWRLYGSRRIYPPPSPLPFGVLPFGHICGGRPHVEHGARLHCLSAFCPSATSSCRLRFSCNSHVSIAFRRSALRPPATYLNTERTESCLHCLSAFCPSATSIFAIISLRASSRLHCLSAFCPSATGRHRDQGDRCDRGLHCLSAFCPSATAR